jgi:hypothetical protein
LDGEEQRHRHAEKYRAIGVTAPDIDVARDGGESQRGDGVSTPPQQRDRSEHDQCQREGVDAAPLRLVVGGAEGADYLEDPNRNGAQPYRSRRGQPHNRKVFGCAWPVVSTGAQTALRLTA